MIAVPRVGFEAVMASGACMGVLEVTGGHGDLQEQRDAVLACALHNLSAISFDLHALAVTGLDRLEPDFAPQTHSLMTRLWRNTLAKQLTGLIVCAADDLPRDRAARKLIKQYQRQGRPVFILEKGAI